MMYRKHVWTFDGMPSAARMLKMLCRRMTSFESSHQGAIVCLGISDNKGKDVSIEIHGDDESAVLRRKQYAEGFISGVHAERRLARQAARKARGK